MAMSAHDFLSFRCNQMLMMEREILNMNNTMADEVQNTALKNKFQSHRATTEQQISNLQQVLDRLGAQQQAQGTGGFMQQVTEMLGISSDHTGTPVTHGMLDEHKSFMRMNPPQNLVDINDAMEGDKVEHLEIVSYNELIALANQLGETEVAQMLQVNLQGEEGMRSSIEQDLPSLLSSELGGGRMAA